MITSKTRVRYDRHSILHERSGLLGDEEEDKKAPLRFQGRQISFRRYCERGSPARVVTSMPSVHTACRYYRSNGLVTFSDLRCGAGSRSLGLEATQTWSLRRDRT
jgi:hypothetical protein